MNNRSLDSQWEGYPAPEQAPAKYLPGGKITLQKCFRVLLMFTGIFGLAISL